MTNSLTSVAEKLETQYGLTPGILAALTRAESGGNMKAVSSAGARGMTQFMPGTRDDMIRKYGVDPWKDPESALKATAIYLAEIREKVGNDPKKMLAGYNWGPENVKKYGDHWLDHAPGATKKYIADIMGNVGGDIDVSYQPGSGNDDDQIERRRRRLRALGMNEDDVNALTPEQMLGAQFLIMFLTLAIAAANNPVQQQQLPIPPGLQGSFNPGDSSDVVGTLPAPLPQFAQRSAAFAQPSFPA